MSHLQQFGQRLQENIMEYHKQMFLGGNPNMLHTKFVVKVGENL